MVFAPMQTGAETGSDSAGGRRVTDNFSPQTHGPFSRRNLVWGRPRRQGNQGTDGDSQSPRVWPGEPPAVGEVPLPTGREGERRLHRALDRTREAGNGNGVRAGHPSPPSSASPPTAAPHHLRRHLFHRFLRLPHGRVVFRSGVLFLLFPSPPPLSSACL